MIPRLSSMVLITGLEMLVDEFYSYIIQEHLILRELH
jgi:hypothetical protein